MSILKTKFIQSFPNELLKLCIDMIIIIIQIEAEDINDYVGI